MRGNDATVTTLFRNVCFPHIDTRRTPGNGARPAKRQYPLFRNAQQMGKRGPAKYADIPGKSVDH